jgi:hypothetical protein
MCFNKNPGGGYDKSPCARHKFTGGLEVNDHLEAPAALTPVNNRLFPLSKGLCGVHSRSESFEKERTFLCPLPGIKLRFLGRSASSLIEAGVCFLAVSAQAMKIKCGSCIVPSRQMQRDESLCQTVLLTWPYWFCFIFGNCLFSF